MTTIDALKTAREALLTAIAACDAAGFAPVINDLRASVDARHTPALLAVESHLDTVIATEERRAVPLTIGGSVEVHHYSGKRWDIAVMTVGAKRVRLADGKQYDHTRGGCTDGYSWIAAVDLHRINRDLVTRPKRERGGAK